MSFGSIGCDQTASFFCNFCPLAEQGRISGIAFVRIGAPLPNPSSRQDWVNISCNNLGIIIPEVRGSYDGGSQIEQPGFGRTPTRRSGATHTLTYNHLFSCENKALYDYLNNNSGEYEVFFSTETKLFRSNKEVHINAMIPITDDTNSQIEFQVEVKWSNKYLPDCYDLPNGIFDSCEALNSAITCLPCQALTINPC